MVLKITKQIVSQKFLQLILKNISDLKIHKYYTYDECLVTNDLSSDEEILTTYNTDIIDITDTKYEEDLTDDGCSANTAQTSKKRIHQSIGCGIWIYTEKWWTWLHCLLAFNGELTDS